MQNPNTKQSAIDEVTDAVKNETVDEVVTETANEAQKAAQNVAEEAGKTTEKATAPTMDKATGQATEKTADAATTTERDNRSDERKDRDGYHGGRGNRNDCGDGCHPRRCRWGKWLAMAGLMLASGIIGGMIGGKIGGYGHHDRFDRFERMPHGGMMQRDGMRGGGPMGQGMGQGQGFQGQGQGQGMMQADPAVQPNPPAPAAQNPQATPPAAPTQNR